MGGFLINGCGAKDYFTKMKYLGERTCPHCKQTAPYYLERVKLKATVLFIPTVPIKERYAIMCDKCRQGNYIEEDKMHRIMSGQAVVSQNEITSGTHQEEEKPAVSSPDMAALISEHPKMCPHCGVEVDGPFCGNCGIKIPQDSLPETIDSSRVCPSCGAEVEGPFCGNCGSKISQDSLPETLDSSQVCPNCGAEVEGPFCGNCGAKLS